MTTVDQAIDRLKRSFLVAPDNQPALSTSLDALTASDTDVDVTLGDFGLIEDEAYLMAGSIIEIGRELMRVSSYEESTKIATVIRSIDSTPLQAHDAGASVTMAPPFPRQSMFEAISDNIVRLFPRLFTVRAELIPSVGFGVFPLYDKLAVDIITAWPESLAEGVSPNYMATIVDYHPLTEGRAVLCSLSSSSLWVRYRRRMDRPEAVSDELEDLGVDQLWEEIIVIGAAADLTMNTDLPYMRADFLGDVAENETIRFGSRTGVSRALAQKRDDLIDQCMREMRAEYRPVVHRRSPWQDKSNVGIG